MRPIVLSLARSTMFSSTTVSSSNRKVHFARPFGGGEHIRAISFASAAPSNAWSRRVRGMLAPQDSLEAFFDQPLAGAVDRRSAHIQSFHDALSLQPSPARETSALSRIRAFRTLAAGCLPLLIRASRVCLSSGLRRTTYF